MSISVVDTLGLGLSDRIYTLTVRIYGQIAYWLSKAIAGLCLNRNHSRDNVALLGLSFFLRIVYEDLIVGIRIALDTFRYNNGFVHVNYRILLTNL